MDAFPNVPMEAMMSGNPVIANEDSCGTREQVFNNLNGLITGDAARLMKALHCYADDPRLLTKHGVAGRELVEARFSVEVQRRCMRDFLQTFLRSESNP
jgi:glycosyltransferase involved in cell wall biosynthesis